MIIYPSGFDATEEAAGRPLSYARIGYQTHARDLDLDATYVTVTSEDDEGPRDAPLRPDSAEAWVPTALPATWQLDFGEFVDIDYVGIAGHTFGSSDCSVLVETSDGTFGAGSPTELAWTTFSSPTTPSDDSALLFLDDSVSASSLRITVTGAGSPSGSGTMPRMGVLYAGEILAMPRSIYGGHAPLALSRDTVLTRALSRGGQILGQAFRRNGLSSSASFRFLDPAWYRAYFDPFVKSARRYPFFFAWRPKDYLNECAYAWCEQDIRPSNMGQREFMQVSLNLRGLGEE